jgi:hypothetical protein
MPDSQQRRFESPKNYWIFWKASAKCAAAEKSMNDTLEFGIFLAILIAFVVVGCLATRAPKKTSNTGPMKHRTPRGEGPAH